MGARCSNQEAISIVVTSFGGIAAMRASGFLAQEAGSRSFSPSVIPFIAQPHSK